MESQFHGMTPYRFSFISHSGKRIYWIRFYRCGMEDALKDCIAVAKKEDSTAHGFAIESDQDSDEIRKSWGL